MYLKYLLDLKYLRYQYLQMCLKYPHLRYLMYPLLMYLRYHRLMYLMCPHLRFLTYLHYHLCLKYLLRLKYLKYQLYH